MATSAEETFLTSVADATAASDAELELPQYITPIRAKRANPLHNLRVMFGMMLSLTLVIVVGVLLAARPSRSQISGTFKPMEVETLVEKRIPAFKKCGGEGFKSKRCEAGCRCVAKNEYFSICTPAGSGPHCDVAAAKAEEIKAAKKAAPLMAIAKKKVGTQVAAAKAFAQAVKEFRGAKATADKAAKVKTEKGKAADEKAAAKIKAVEDNTKSVKHAADATKVKFEKMVAEEKKEAQAQEGKQNVLSKNKLNATLVKTASLKKLAQTAEKKEEAAAAAELKDTLQILERKKAEAKKKWDEAQHEAKEDAQEKVVSAEKAAKEAKEQEKLAEEAAAKAAEAKVRKAKQQLKEAQEVAHVNVSKALTEEKQVKAAAAKKKEQVLAAVAKVAEETSAKAKAAKAEADKREVVKKKATKEAIRAKNDVKDLAANVTKWKEALV